jgi:hypothetical protein
MSFPGPVRDHGSGPARTVSSHGRRSMAIIRVGRFSAGGRQRYRLTADDKGAPAEPSRHQRQPLEALRLPQLQPQPAALSVRPPGQAVVVEHGLARRADRDQSEAPSGAATNDSAASTR